MATKAKKMPRFYIVLIWCWCIALCLLGIALFIVNGYLADYESVQPKYVAEEIFNTYFQTKDYGAILEYSDINDSPFETDEALAEYLFELTEEKELSYHPISSGMDTGVSKYIVKYNENEKEIKIASFTLALGNEKSEKGFSKYELRDFELFYPENISVEIKAVRGTVPYVNGTALGEEYIVEDDIEHESCAHMPEGVEGIKYTLYRVDGLVCQPKLSAKDAQGNDIKLSYAPLDGYYVTDISYDETLAAEQSEHVIAAAQAFAAYMQNDTTIGKLSPYFDKTTELYRSIKSTLQWAVIDHDSYHFEDAEASEFYRYDENTFSCRVKFVHVLKRKRLEDYRDTVDATFYLHNVDGKYLVYDRTNN